MLNQRGERGQARLRICAEELATYRDTSMRARIQKNINLLDLEGKPPGARGARVPGTETAAAGLAARQARAAVLLGALVSGLQAGGADPGPDREGIRRRRLVIIAPTQRYGYVARGEDAGPAEELKYIEEVRQKYYAGPVTARRLR